MRLNAELLPPFVVGGREGCVSIAHSSVKIRRQIGGGVLEQERFAGCRDLVGRDRNAT
jgi:hypothetical protein